MEQKKWSLQIGGRILEVETGLLAGQANGAVTARYGDTVVLATAVMSESVKEGGDYLPLTVDFEERFYASGRILGSRYMRREGKPSDDLRNRRRVSARAQIHRGDAHRVIRASRSACSFGISPECPGGNGRPSVTRPRRDSS